MCSPYQRYGKEEGAQPGVLAHAVFGEIDWLARGSVAVGLAGFTGHDAVNPGAAEEAVIGGISGVLRVPGFWRRLTLLPNSPRNY